MSRVETRVEFDPMASDEWGWGCVVGCGAVTANLPPDQANNERNANANAPQFSHPSPVNSLTVHPRRVARRGVAQRERERERERRRESNRR